ncbi:MAG TPA: hypothetical protein VHS53_10640 [Mucilaginibacter sp.]|nr:hypothetical protein [Mucilaginibacter sp.]
MNQPKGFAKYLILFAPWAIASIFSFLPAASYLIAWLGSFFIFFMTLKGKIKPIPQDRTMAEQIMRPLFIVQIIFAGYMCCTSIFYFLNVLGYQYFAQSSYIQAIDAAKLELTAQCQRYYCLGHAAMATGILAFMKYPIEQKYYVEKEKLANLLFQTALVSFPVSLIFQRVPGLAQFFFQLYSLSFMACTLALAFAIPLRKMMNTLICLALYLFNLEQSIYSGFKEPIILSILILGIFLYPNYKKLVMMTFVPMIVLLFVFLPAYVASFRQNAWSGEETAEDASKIALDASLNNKDETNWEFLVYRFSEIDMFTQYVGSTPDQIGYYKFQLLNQSAIALVPRIFWPSKPITEEMVMERVYDAGVANRSSSVSAKPAYIVDAYLSYGAVGIFIGLFAYGAIAQLIAQKAEYLFGGYTLGTALVFSGLFQIMWRGLSFEFIINTVFWSYVTMLIVFKVFRSRNIVKLL